MMNVERNPRDSEQYLVGDGTPSEFGEDVHPGPYRDTSDNAVGLPQHSEWHQDKMNESWNEGEPYDNQGPDQGKISEKRMAEIEKEYEKKAHKCVKIANALFGGDAEEDLLEKQALDLMSLPDESVTATLNRLSRNVEASKLEPSIEENGGRSREASHPAEGHAQPDQMHHPAQGNQREDHSSHPAQGQDHQQVQSGESVQEEQSDDEVIAALQDVIGDGQGQQPQPQQSQQAPALNQGQGGNEMQTLQDVVSNSSEMKEAERAQQIQELSNPNGGSVNHSNEDNLSVDMTTPQQPDKVHPEDMEGSDVLSSLIQEGEPEESGERQKEGVQSLGRVKEGSSQQGGQSESVALSNIWDGQPDVSDVFNV
jgi:hypothetical protein